MTILMCIFTILLLAASAGGVHVDVPALGKNKKMWAKLTTYGYGASGICEVALVENSSPAVDFAVYLKKVRSTGEGDGDHDEAVCKGQYKNSEKIIKIPLDHSGKASVPTAGFWALMVRSCDRFELTEVNLRLNVTQYQNTTTGRSFAQIGDQHLPIIYAALTVGYLGFGLFRKPDRSVLGILFVLGIVLQCYTCLFSGYYTLHPEERNIPLARIFSVSSEIYISVLMVLLGSGWRCVKPLGTWDKVSLAVVVPLLVMECPGTWIGSRVVLILLVIGVVTRTCKVVNKNIDDGDTGLENGVDILKLTKGLCYSYLLYVVLEGVAKYLLPDVVPVTGTWVPPLLREVAAVGIYLEYGRVLGASQDKLYKPRKSVGTGDMEQI
eukprot:TRINITY_DN809_c4_g1_i1.p1 TRINITY_DN809_c4_g1~~TRINITY_DN809_c4_g1_i1.p1  ORF type:complete len:381 (+),score=23.41 TRINITY_DN809_c4_g1_i1:59-1201(+)